MNKIKKLLMLLLFLCSFTAGFADEYKANLSTESGVTGNNETGDFGLEAKLLTGLPFELSFNVSTSGSSYNQWGSCLFATGTDPLANTYPGGFQLYLRSATNGNHLVVKIGSGESHFYNIKHDEPFSIAFSFNGKNKLTLTATNTNDNENPVAETKEFTVTGIDISNFCYALPAGINIANLSITCDAAEIVNLAQTKLEELQGYQGRVGFPTEEECEKIAKVPANDEEALQLYKDYLSFIAYEAQTVLPQLGKVYYIFNVVRTNPAVATYLKGDGATFGLSNSLPAASDPQLFQYMWVPRIGSTSNKMYFMSTSGAKKRLAWNGVSDEGTEWTVEQGLSYGFLSLKSADNSNKYAAAYTNCSGFGGWSKTCYASGKQQYPNTSNWSTDFMMLEAPYTSLDLSISGLTGDESATVNYRFNDDIHMEGLQSGDVVVIHNDNLSSLTASMFTPSAVPDKTPVVTIDNGKVNVLYTSYSLLYDAATTETAKAKARLDAAVGGALYSSEAISNANESLTLANEYYNAHKSEVDEVKKAMDMVSEAMETFFKTIDGKYVTICKDSKYITTTSATGVSLTGTSPATVDKYFGVYRLYYVGNGAYQLQNAYRGNWLGQTTSNTNLGSCAASTAEKWRGNYRFVVSNSTAEEGYDLQNVNGVAEYQHLAVSENNVVRAAAETLWDVRLAPIAGYTTAYINQAKYANGVSGEETAGYQKTIGHKTAYVVTKALEDAVTTAAGDEHKLVAATNTFINNKEEINLPSNGDFITLTNVGKSTYTLGENHYEMKSSTDAIDLGKVWKVEVSDGKYYLKNAKTGFYLGATEKSTQARLTERNKLPYEFVSADAEHGYVALHDKGTNSAYSYIHIDGNNKTVGWSYVGSNTSQWTVSTINDSEALKGYFNTATTALRTKIGAAVTAWTNAETPSTTAYFAKNNDVKTAAQAEAGKTTSGDNATEAEALYAKALKVYKDFNAAGKAFGDNEVVLLRNRNTPNTQGGAADANKYYVVSVLDDGSSAETECDRSMTNGQTTNADTQYAFSAWQLQPTELAGCYRLFNFFTGVYLSKNKTQSQDVTGRERYALTMDAEEAMIVRVENHDGWYVTLHNNDYDEKNDGYLRFVNYTGVATKIAFGLANGNITTQENYCQYELLPMEKAQYVKCLDQILEYKPLLGKGVGKYTDKTGEYTAKTKNLDGYSSWTVEQIASAVREIAPTLANVRINKPTNKHFYRIYCLGDGEHSDTKGTTKQYISAPDGVANYNIASVASSSSLSGNNITGTVFYYDGQYLLNYRTGKHVGGNGSPWMQGTIGQMWSNIAFDNSGYVNKGCYSMKPEGRSYYYLHKTGGSALQLNGWGSAYNVNTEWYLEELESLPVVVTSAGYATLCSPVALQVPAGVTAYVADGVVGTSITLESVKAGKYASRAIIPVNTPVLLKATAGTYQFPLVDDLNADAYEYHADEFVNNNRQYIKSTTYYPYNKFYGSVPTVNNTDDEGNSAHEPGYEKYYTLQNPATWSSPSTSPVGFYRYTGSVRNGFKAYYRAADISAPAPAEGKGFSLVFDDDATGADAVVEDIKNNIDAIFDIAGNRVVDVTKRGIYIINGKKYQKK